METAILAVGHQYPDDLARFVRENWCDRWPEGDLTLPPLQLLREILSTCYQSSLLAEESVPVVLRVVVLPSQSFEPAAGPPEGFHRLVLVRPRPLTAYNLKKLSPAVELSHSLLGVEFDETGAPVIWGIVHSGSRWAEQFHGGRQTVSPLPSSLVVSVIGPGSLSVSNGSVVIAKLMKGIVSAPHADVFASQWMFEHFQPNQDEIWDTLGLEGVSNRLDFGLVRRVTQGMFRRVLNQLRQEGKGATFLLTLCEEDGFAEEEWAPFVDIKYRFLDEEPRRRYRTLLTDLMRTLILNRPEGRVLWSDFVECKDPAVELFEEAQTEFSHMLTGLASVDGAVLLNRRFEVLGFGSEISGTLPLGPVIYRAVDIEGLEVVPEPTDDVGSRHRSVFRLCWRFPQILGVVVSQDGRVLVVKNRHGRLVCWDQLSTSPLDL